MIMNDNLQSPEMAEIYANAVQIAETQNQDYLLLEHVFLALILYPPFYKTMKSYGTDIASLTTEFSEYIKQEYEQESTDRTTRPKPTQTVNRVFQRAVNKVVLSNRNQVETIDLFFSIASETRSAPYYFIVKYIPDPDGFAQHWMNHYKAETKEGNKLDQASGVLSKYCRNLNEAAKNNELEPLIGRDQEIIDMVDILAKKFKMNVLMIGDPGTGKTAICEGLAQRIVAGDVPDFLKDRIMWCLEMGSLVAGTRYRGEFEEKIKEIIEALESTENGILFIDEAHTMHGAGSTGKDSGLDFSNMIKPAITRGKIMVIANTTWEEYYESFEKDRAFMRRFYRLTINEPSRDDNIKILTGVAKRLEDFHKVVIDQSAIDASVDLSSRYIFERKNPDKAIDMLDAACAKQRALDKKGVTILESNIVREVSKATGIPESRLSNKQTEKLCNLKRNIYSKLFGQETAVEKVIDTVMVSFSGLGDAHKPVASFLFTGPTGTGKTELCKLLSEYLDMHLIRYDMSEFMEKHTVSRLIGAPPGYVGFSDGQQGGGQLISAVTKDPYSILLMDEIEKAHPDVFNILLQIMDEGRVSSSSGKTVDMHNCIVIMTTNLGAEDNEQNNIGFTVGLDRTGAEDIAVKKFFRPEFRNRLSSIIKFSKLSPEVVRKVVAKFLNQLREDLKPKNIQIHVNEDVITYLVETGYDSKMGARPLDRKIESEIKMPLSKKLLFEGLHDIELTLEMENGEIVVKHKQNYLVKEECFT